MNTIQNQLIGHIQWNLFRDSIILQNIHEQLAENIEFAISRDFPVGAEIENFLEQASEA